MELYMVLCLSKCKVKADSEWYWLFKEHVTRQTWILHNPCSFMQVRKKYNEGAKKKRCWSHKPGAIFGSLSTNLLKAGRKKSLLSFGKLIKICARNAAIVSVLMVAINTAEWEELAGCSSLPWVWLALTPRLTSSRGQPLVVSPRRIVFSSPYWCELFPHFSVWH